MTDASTTKTVWAAVVGNLLVAVTKLGAAITTGSSAMLSEAFHSFVDTGNEALLLYGLHRSTREPDAVHPFGYGREVYFWSFVVGLMLFGIGCIASIVEGAHHILTPEKVANATVIYVVLALSAVFEGASWLTAFKGFRPSVGSRGYVGAILASKNPPQFVVLLEDSAAIIGIFIAAVGTGASEYWNEPRLDGVASIAIGILLGAVAILIARESKALLIGERADPRLQEQIFQIARSIKGVVCPNGMVSLHLAPEQVVIALSVEFEDSLKVPQIERAVSEMETQIRNSHPSVFLLFVKPQTSKAFSDSKSGSESRR